MDEVIISLFSSLEDSPQFLIGKKADDKRRDVSLSFPSLPLCPSLTTSPVPSHLTNLVLSPCRQAQDSGSKMESGGDNLHGRATVI